MAHAQDYKQEPHDPEPIEGFNPLAVNDEFGLTTKMAFFCEWYLVTLNGTKAARKAGYAYPIIDGSRLLASANVRKYLDYRFGERKITPNAILDRLQAIAHADISDYLIVDPTYAEEKDGVFKLTSGGKVLDGVWIDLKRALKDGNTSVIKSYKRVKGETVIELHDPIRALELLGKHYRLFADVTVNSPKPDGTADILPDDTLEAIARQGLGDGAASDVLSDGPADEPLFNDD